MLGDLLTDLQVGLIIEGLLIWMIVRDNPEKCLSDLFRILKLSCKACSIFDFLMALGRVGG
jgi:hypothetical protein